MPSRDLPATLPNVETERRTLICHTLDLPSCCPVSGNPQPGSTITIAYRAAVHVLDVIPLRGYLRRYVGGLRSPVGDLEVRDMEGMIGRIAQDCADAVGVPVRVRADLLLQPRQRMQLVARAHP